MVCIAAFIILIIIGVFVALISIFKPEVGKSYLKMLKKSWGCLWKKVRLQKCETGFKDDVKNTLLSHVIIKHPKWVKPLSALIEVVSVIIVIIAVWALATAIKSLLALWALGSCNVSKPSACTLGAEVCSIDQEEPSNIFEATGRWFTEWGDIFAAIPDKFKTYNVDDYDLNYVTYTETSGSISENEDADSSDEPTTEKEVVISIFDPGCSVCLSSYNNEKDSGFFEKYEVRLVPFPIQDANGTYKFANSRLIVGYIYAAEEVQAGSTVDIIDRVYTWRDEEDVSYQVRFNDFYSAEEVEETLKSWLKDLGFADSEITEIATKAMSAEMDEKLAHNYDVIVNEMNITSIPTMIYGGTKHVGLYTAE